jgi:hypothetical protein
MTDLDRSVGDRFAPLKPTLPDGVTFDVDPGDDGDRWRLRADRDIDGWATGFFAQPCFGVDLAVDQLDRGCRFLGFGFGQFALPVVGSPDRGFAWNPADNVNSPPAVVPLVVGWPDGFVSLLAPLDSWHEQIFAVDQDDDGINRFRWGWHGDLELIPAGTTCSLGLYHGASVAELFTRWGDDLRAHYGTAPRPESPVTSQLSYWTDNGAAYWYRTEPGRDLATSLVDKLAELDRLGVSVGSVELDSWFYRHEISRPVTEIDDDPAHVDGDETVVVPPTGMLTWQPRADVIPQGVDGVADQLGGRPLILHARHISPQSPYLHETQEDDQEDSREDNWWVELTAQPADPAFFDRWMADAASWGATCVEQDWMIMSWFGARPLRARPGRAMAWLQGLDEAAARHALTLIWCMSTPGDLMATVELPRVVAARTCDDYRYAADPARLWRWYLTVNRLADGLGLAVFKDCFFTATDPGPSGHDGDPHAEFEALLSALSAGPAGIGDRLGHTDPDIVARLCGPDGVLIQPDRPLALADRSFFDTADSDRLTWAETETAGEPADGSETGGRPWRYVVAVHAADGDATIADRFDLGHRHLIYDWRAGTAEAASVIEVSLAKRDWGYWVCCPIEVGPDGIEQAVIGDPRRYATAAGFSSSSLTTGDRPPLTWRADLGLVEG